MQTWDAKTKSLCDNLINCVGLAAGFCDGLKMGSNTKASVMRIGLVEAMELLRAKAADTNNLSEAEMAVFNSIVEAAFDGPHRVFGEKYASQWTEDKKFGRCSEADKIFFDIKTNIGSDTDRFPFFKNVINIALEDLNPKMVIPCNWDLMSNV